MSVLQNRPADCEVVLAHVLPYDDPYGVGDEVRLIHAPAATSLAGLINAALPQLEGEIIHLLACGVEVTEHWTEPALAHFHDPEVAAVAPLLRSGSSLQAGVSLTADGRRRIVATRSSGEMAELESQVIGPSLAAGFYHRDVLIALGGFDEQVDDAHLDLDLGLAMSDLGLRTVLEASLPLTIGAAETLVQSRGIAAGAAAERFYVRHAERCSVAGLGRVLRALLGDAAYLPRGEAFTRPLGRLMARLENGTGEQHAQRVEAAAVMLEQFAAATLSLDAARPQQAQPATTSQRRAA